MRGEKRTMTEEQIEAIVRRAVTVTAEPSGLVEGGHYWVVRIQPGIGPSAARMPFEVCSRPEVAEVILEQLQGLVRWTLQQRVS
jgi:hypothetical protein